MLCIRGYCTKRSTGLTGAALATGATGVAVGVGVGVGAGIGAGLGAGLGAGFADAVGVVALLCLRSRDASTSRRIMAVSVLAAGLERSCADKLLMALTLA